MSNNNRIGQQCWYRRVANPSLSYKNRTYKWFLGIFRNWSTDSIDCGELGYAPFPCAVIEDVNTLRIYSVHVSEITFAPNPPNDNET